LDASMKCVFESLCVCVFVEPTAPSHTNSPKESFGQNSLSAVSLRLKIRNYEKNLVPEIL
jgi:hypothetical protein